MAITRKPKPPTFSPAAAVDVEALINKGGSVATTGPAMTATSDKPVPVMLRMPADALARVDQAIKERRVRIPRHTWLLEAVIEKLEREA